MFVIAMSGALSGSGGRTGRPRCLFPGETHLHTVLSFDSYVFGNRNSPDDAYRYARGEAIRHPAGFEMKIDEPLDFQSVTDHAIYLGMLPAMHEPRLEVSKHPISLKSARPKRRRSVCWRFKNYFRA